MRIIPDLLPDDHPLTRLPMTPRYITVHDTANPARGANAEMHGRYLRSQEAIDREVSWHFTVDDHEIRQHLPLDRNGWHAGDGWDGPGNRQSIAIEICENSDGDRAAAEANAAMLVAHLVRTVPTLLPFPECVVQHNHWSGKDCPRVIRSRPGGWGGFIRMIEQYLKAEQSKTAPFSDVPANHWAAEAIARAKELELMSGHPDGTFGLGKPLKREEAAVLAVNLRDRILADILAALNK